MTFDDYAFKALATAIYPAIGNGPLSRLIYPALKLNGEAGEVAEKIGKLFRDKAGAFPADDRRQLALELGDVLWYLAALAFELGLPLSEVAAMNLEKLASRNERKTLSGSGDNR